MLDEIKEFIAEHDKRANAINEMLAPLYQKINKLSDKVDDKLERYMGEISLKMNSMVIHQTEIKKDIEHIMKCQNENKELQEKQDELISDNKKRIDHLEIDKKWVTGISSLVSGLVAFIITITAGWFK